MNRFLLAFALAFGLAAGASAQSNSATTEQTGSNNAASVVQSGGATATVNQGASGAPASDNAVEVRQAGMNTADVDQTGNNNDARVQQGIRINGSGAGTASGNTANVLQSGSNNSGLLGGSGDDASVVAQGVNGTALNSTADLTQSGTRGRAQVYQGNNGGGASGAFGRINQAGDNNEASVRQGVQDGVSDRSEATITQTMDVSNSEASIHQGADGVGSFSVPRGGQASQQDQATINQNAGSMNMAAINQGVDGRRSEGNRATISQTNPFARSAPNGGNQTTVNQADWRGNVTAQSRGADNTVTITQGYGTAEVSQSLGATVTLTGSNHEVTIDQDGFSSKATFATVGGSNDQLTTNNVGTIEQHGDFNNVRVIGIDGSFNEVTVTQIGDRNDVNNIGGGSTTTPGFLSIAGDRNELIVDQTGDYGIVRFAINGNDNDAIVTQSRVGVAGAGDTATVMQNGNGNTSTITQN